MASKPKKVKRSDDIGLTPQQVRKAEKAYTGLLNKYETTNNQQLKAITRLGDVNKKIFRLERDAQREDQHLQRQYDAQIAEQQLQRRTLLGQDRVRQQQADTLLSQNNQNNAQLTRNQLSKRQRQLAFQQSTLLSRIYRGL